MKTHFKLVQLFTLTAALTLGCSTVRSADQPADSQRAEEAAHREQPAELRQQAKEASDQAAVVSAQARELEERPRREPRKPIPARTLMSTSNPFVYSSHESARPLVILKDPGDVKTSAEVEEDLKIMARILQKSTTGRDDSKQAMGISLFNPSEGSKTGRMLYLEGYGAVFMLSVNFPFSPPPSATQEVEPKEDANAEWEEARRELHHSSEGVTTLKWDQAFTSALAAEEYDSRKVENLKDGLVGTLKNAAHIRMLKSDESVVVVVNGRSPASDTKVVSSGHGSSANWKIVAPSGPDRPGTQMILRAKKSDLETFQKEKLSLEEFRKRVSLTIT